MFYQTTLFKRFNPPSLHATLHAKCAVKNEIGDAHSLQRYGRRGCPFETNYLLFTRNEFRIDLGIPTSKSIRRSSLYNFPFFPAIIKMSVHLAALAIAPEIRNL